MVFDRANQHPDTKTDRQLLAEARDGHGESFEVLFRRHHAVVLSFLARRVEGQSLPRI